MPARYDVVIVGGGPAGASCARRLALAGLEVCVIDREAPPRYKTCGGGLVGRAYQLLEAELDLGPVTESRSAKIDLHLLDADLAYRVERPATPVLLTMRARLDEALLQAARAAGAKLLAPCTLEDLQPSDSEVTLLTDIGPLRADFVVAADGAASPTARAAGWPAHPSTIPALESELYVAPADYERFGEAARFDFGHLPHGYAWIFPKERHLSVGCLSTLRVEGGLQAELDRWLARIGLDPGVERDDHGFVIPIAPRRPLARGRVLLTGDAAGLADPVTCEGISNAIASGQLAARAIAESPDDARSVRAAYLRLLTREVLPELRAARWLARLLYGWPTLRTFMFRRLGQRMCEAVTDVCCGARTYRSLVGRPATYVRAAAGLLSGREPGAEPGTPPPPDRP